MKYKFHAEPTNSLMPNLSLKRLAFALALTGVMGTLSVYAAPKVTSKGNKPKSTPRKPSASQSTKSVKSSPNGANTDQEVIASLRAQGFVSSGYAGVVVRNVPGPSQQLTSAEAEAADGPVLSNERPAPGGGMMADLHSPREFETVNIPATTVIKKPDLQKLKDQVKASNLKKAKKSTPKR